jgi:ribonuclease R
MSRKKKNKSAAFPSRQAVLSYIKESGGLVKKGDIAKAFHIRGEDRKQLNDLLREFRQEGLLQGEGRNRRLSGFLPPVTVVEITGTNEDGEAIATPVKWEDTNKAPPHIIVTTEHKRQSPAVGEHVLVKLRNTGKNSYEAGVLRILPKKTQRKVLGVFQATKRGGVLEPVNRKKQHHYFVPKEYCGDIASGELVLAEVSAGSKDEARIIERLGDSESPQSYSLIAIHHHEIPVDFSAEALEQAESAQPPTLSDGRVDLRKYALITIDGADARDFDDAVWAEKTRDGWHLIVAIADVAHYVPPDSPLDKEAIERGNSTYFPDRVVPMLPEALSNGLCSLRPDEDRYCLAVHLTIDEDGTLLKHKFVRGLMRSHARLTYEQVQHAWDTKDGDPALLQRLEPLYGAFKALYNFREKRGALELNLPEYYTKLDDDGQVSEIAVRQRLDSHRLIEEFMVCANVAAAEAIERSGYEAIFRVHEAPAPAKVSELISFLKTMDYSLPKTPQGKHFNQLLEKVSDTPEEALINGSILRAQMQACYTPNNLGHFGLGLEMYCHFTSPIRRYADLVVHRALIAMAEGKAPEFDESKLGSIANHISETERKSMLAEREAKDRYVTAFMATHGDAEFTGSISSVGNFGIFVTLHDNGASGIIRMGDLGDDFYVYDEKTHRLVGRHSGSCFQLGQRVTITVQEADTQLGTLRFSLVSAAEVPPATLTENPRKKSRRNPDKKPTYRKRRKKKG